MDEGEEELRLEAKTVQDCSIAVSHAVAIPPCRPPWHFKKGVRISDKLELEPLALVLEGGPACWAVVHPTVNPCVRLIWFEYSFQCSVLILCGSLVLEKYF